MALEIKKVIVTGATSFLGRNFVNKLLKEKMIVFAIVRDINRAKEIIGINENIRYVQTDLENLADLKKYIKNADWFVHFAWDGSGNVGRSDSIIQNKNVEYSMEAFKIAIELGCQKFLFPGSQAEYGQCYDEIIENRVCNPISEYGKAKMKFSQQISKMAESEKIIFIHTRIFSVYGYGDRADTLIDLCIKGFNNSINVKLGSCTQKWNYLYIDDFCNILFLLMMNINKNDIVNIASKDTRCLRDYINVIKKMSNGSGDCLFGDIILNPEGSPQLIPNIDKMLMYTNYETFCSFEDGILQIMRKENII